MMTLRKFGWTGLILSIAFFYGCYPKGAETVDDTELVYTVYDEDFVFSPKTYYLHDTVIYIDSTAERNAQTDALILNEIAAQFDKLGYERVPAINDPSEVNMVVMSSVLKATVTGVNWYPGWGGWYGGWWGGWGYPGWGYPGGYIPVAYSYKVGSIFIDAFDSQSLDSTSNIMPPIVWTAAMNSVLTSSGIGQDTRIKRVIDQAFVQSPYLNGGPN